MLLLYNDFNDNSNAECPAFDTNPYNVSSRDDIDTSVNDAEPWTVFIHIRDVVACIRGLIGLMNALCLHNI